MTLEGGTGKCTEENLLFTVFSVNLNKQVQRHKRPYSNNKQRNSREQKSKIKYFCNIWKAKTVFNWIAVWTTLTFLSKTFLFYSYLKLNLDFMIFIYILSVSI